jgi:hypothetical protein
MESSSVWDQALQFKGGKDLECSGTHMALHLFLHEYLCITFDLTENLQMESVRKDIECCFGIMKVRFRILVHPVQYMSRGSKKVCRVMRTMVCVVYLFAACRNTSEKSTTLFGHVVFCTTSFWLLMVQLNDVGFCAGNLCPNDEFILALAGLDKLWTEEDYLSAWYADADADIHAEYDRYTADHCAIIATRAKARLRNFGSYRLGKKRPTASIGVQPRSGSLVPQVHHSDPMSQVIFSEEDSDPLQWDEGYEKKRDALIEHFNCFWNQNKVLWLSFPGTAKNRGRK